MALRATVCCGLHLVSFRNIDIVTAALYRLEIRIAQGENRLTPEELTAAERSPYGGRHCVGLPHVIKSESSFVSCGFLISFSDEEIHLGDFVQFRGDISAQRGLLSADLLVEVALQFCPTYTEAQFRAATQPPDNAYVEVSKAVLRLSNPCLGADEYTQAIFPDPHFAVSPLVLHIAAVNWDYQPEVLPGGEEEIRLLRSFLFPSVGPSLSLADLHRVFSEFLFPLLLALRKKQQLVSRVERIDQFSPIPYQNSFRDHQQMDESLVLAETLATFQAMSEGNDAETVADFVLNYLQSISTAISSLFAFTCTLSRTQFDLYFAFFSRIYAEDTAKLYQKSLIRKETVVDSVPLISESESSLHEKSHPIRESQRDFSPFRLNPLDFPPLSAEPVPVLLEESYRRADTLPIEGEAMVGGTFLYVLVSGYGGSSADVRQLRNFIALNHPKGALFLVSKANDGRTDADIEEMGQLLATEVRGFIDQQCGFSLQRVIFIGHSLGGLIIRAALPLLSDYKRQMHAFLSLSSPHLGLIYSKSKLMKAGIWVLESIRRSKCLKQLKMKDNSELTKTELYVLSAAEGLNWFKHVIFFSSKQDKYAPGESARVELSAKARDGSEKGCLFVEMVSRLLSLLAPERVRRISVDFGISEVSINRVIGRKAHIEFIENRRFMMALCQSFAEVFT